MLRRKKAYLKGLLVGNYNESTILGVLIQLESFCTFYSALGEAYRETLVSLIEQIKAPWGAFLSDVN